MSASAGRGRRLSCCTALEIPGITCGRRLQLYWSRDHTVIVPDPTAKACGAVGASGWRLHQKNQAVDIAGVMDALQVKRADLVTHDIGNMVGYALAAQFPQRITDGRSSMHRCPASAIGTAFFAVHCCGTSTSAAPMKSDSCRDGSASILTDSTMSYPRIRVGSIPRHATTMPLSTPNLMPCTTPLSSLARFPKMRLTTRRFWLKEAS